MRIIIKAFLPLLILMPILPGCPPAHTLYINDLLTPICLPCNPGCEICMPNELKSTNCVMCQDGFYSKEHNLCQPCVQNCQNCIGPKIRHCRSPLPGFFYDSKTLQFEKCETEGCARCSSKDSCFLCVDGFYLSDMPLQISQAHPFLQICKSCQIPNCLHCKFSKSQINELLFLSCAICKPQFALVSGKCQPCSSHCLLCRAETLECAYCENGFHLQKGRNMCLSIDTLNCLVPFEDGSCNICEAQFFIDDSKKCELCKKFIPECSFCVHQDSKLVCLNCEITFYLLPEKNECHKCEDNCFRCTSLGKCLVCALGFFFDSQNNKCTKCKIINCNLCKNNQVCSFCFNGFYFNEQTEKCVECPDECLRCSNDGKNCITCPCHKTPKQEQITIYREDKITPISSLFTILFSIFRPTVEPVTIIKSEIRSIVKCIDPFSNNSSIISVSLSNNKRIISVEHLTGAFSSDDNLTIKIQKLRENYILEIERTKKEAFIKSKNTDNKNNIECYLNGILKRKIKGNVGSYFECECKNGYIGDNCQISESLFASTQIILLEFIEQTEVEFLDHDNHHSKRFLSILSHLTKFRTSPAVILKIVQIMQVFLKINSEIDTRKDLYLLYDSLLLSCYDNIEEIQKSMGELSSIETKTQETKHQVFDLIHTLIEMLENSLEDFIYVNSFLEQNEEHFKSLNSYSFIIIETRIRAYNEQIGIKVPSPNIDTSFNAGNSNKVFFEFKSKPEVVNMLESLQVLVFSEALFEEKLKTAGFKSFSNLFYLKLLNPFRPKEIVDWRERKFELLRIEFSLNFVPAYENVIEVVSCLALRFSEKEDKIEGRAIAFSDSNLTVTCEFFSYFELQKYYFFVAEKKIKV